MPTELVWHETALGYRSECGRYSIRNEGDGWRPRVYQDAAAETPEYVGTLYGSPAGARAFCEADADLADSPLIVTAADLRAVGVDGGESMVSPDEIPF